MEPWDGQPPFLLLMGNTLELFLDRNGLRPSRYSVTKDGYVVMSSEAGVLDMTPANCGKTRTLRAWKNVLSNMDEGRIIEDDEIKKKVTKTSLPKVA